MNGNVDERTLHRDQLVDAIITALEVHGNDTRANSEVFHDIHQHVGNVLKGGAFNVEDHAGAKSETNAHIFKNQVLKRVGRFVQDSEDSKEKDFQYILSRLQDACKQRSNPDWKNDPKKTSR